MGEAGRYGRKSIAIIEVRQNQNGDLKKRSCFKIIGLQKSKYDFCTFLLGNLRVINIFDIALLKLVIPFSLILLQSL
jgi:hypothetical protein